MYAARSIHHVSGIIYPPPHVCRTILPSPVCTYAAPFIHRQKLPSLGFNDNVFVPEYVSNTQPLNSLGLDSSKWATGIVCFLQLKFNHCIVSLPIKLPVFFFVFFANQIVPFSPAQYLLFYFICLRNKPQVSKKEYNKNPRINKGTDWLSLATQKGKQNIKILNPL